MYDNAEGTTDTSDAEATVEKNFINSNPNDISVDDLDRIGSEYVFLGDYHRYQRLPTKKCKAFYTGSTERTNLSEVGTTKGFIVYDTEAEDTEATGRSRFIEYPDPRPLLQLSGTILDMKEALNNVDASDYQESIVKLAFEGNSADMTDFTTAVDSFREEIQQKLKSIHVYDTHKTINEEVDEEMSALQEQMTESDEIEEEQIFVVAKEIIKDIVGDEDQKELDAMNELAQEIWDARLDEGAP
jgi:DNA repair exonuclease SbcCD nuclease subunit